MRFFSNKTKVKPLIRMAVLSALLLTIVLMASTIQQAQAALPGSCADDDVGSFITEDTTWAGDIYVANDVIVRNSTLTVSAGTTVFICGDHRIDIGDLFNPAQLVAEGSASEPIVFQTADGVPAWQGLYFGDALELVSIMRYVEVHDAGSQDAAVVISDRHAQVELNSPILDQVTIMNSDNYGLDIEIDNESDPTPPAISNLTILNSGNAPIISEAAGVSSLNSNLTLQNNMTNTIQVRGSNLNGGMFFDQHWRDHGVPYELLGSVYLRENYEFRNESVWMIDPNVTLLMHPNADITIGSLFGDGRLLANGTPDHPITITRLNDTSDPWGTIFFDFWSETDSELTYVDLSYGGQNGVSTLEKDHSGVLTLDHVTVNQSAQNGVYASNGRLTVNYSTFDQNMGYGVEILDANTVIRNTVFTGNGIGAVQNNRTDNCVDAAGNYWGSADGPADSTTGATTCNDKGQTNNGAGGAVSDGVLYQPWFTSSNVGDITDRSTLSTGEQFWVVANGIDSAEIEIIIRDEAGAPVAGKQISLQTTLGAIQQPTAMTDANGRTTAVITSKNIGEAVITAFNETDNKPVFARLMLYFWQGGDDTGGLISQGGTIYSSPALQVEGEPFQVGFPVILRLPMQNSLPNAIDVNVEYSVTDFGIGGTFEPVVSSNAVLQPNETWDAVNGFVPPNNNHRCVQYAVTVNDLTSSVETSYTFSGRRNLSQTENPCKEPNANKLIPRKVGGLSAVRKHFSNLKKQTRLVSRCIDSIGGSNRMAFGGMRDYEVLATLPTLDAPTLIDTTGLTPAQVTAANEASQLAANIAAFNIALSQTQQRINDASQADAWNDAARQLTHYRTFEAQRIEALLALADVLDAFVADGGLDEFYTVDDYMAYLNELQTTGYDAETRAYHQQTGLTAAQIDAMLLREIETLQTQAFEPISLLESLSSLSAELRAEATENFQYIDGGIGIGGRSALGTNENLVRIQTITEEFALTNPKTTTETVDLLVRPGNLPINWTYELDIDSIELGPGETTMVQLTIDTGETAVLTDIDSYIAVEGFIGDELIGGVMFQQRVPLNQQTQIYLPIIIR